MIKDLGRHLTVGIYRRTMPRLSISFITPRFYWLTLWKRDFSIRIGGQRGL